MTNLLAETIQAIVASGHAIQDVRHVRSWDGKYAISWKEFAEMANFDYDSGYGAQHIPEDLVVEFEDNTYLRRGEYDGSEWWEFARPLIPVSPHAQKIKTLESDYWTTLEDIH